MSGPDSSNAGEFRVVFDGDEWRAAGFDQPDGNLRFSHAAEVIEPTSTRCGEATMTIRFLHDGRVSEGHFVSHTPIVSTEDSCALAKAWARDDGWDGPDDPACPHGALYGEHAARIVAEVASSRNEVQS